MLTRARLWVRSIVLRGRLEREMQEEMAEHLERSAARLVARGLSPEEARREAIREFGNVAYLQEEARFARGTGWLGAVAADLRFALRQFARRPGVTLTMLLVLATGITISTLLFTYVHSYAGQPPVGVALEDDLVRIRGSQDAGVYGRSSRSFSEEEFLAYRQLTDHFRAVAGWTDAMVALSVGETVERRGLDAKASFVTENYFSVLGVQPVLGSGLSAVEPDGATTAAVAVIGYTAWDQLFGRSPDVIGSTIDVNGVPVTVVGVAPERFTGIGMLTRFALWMPLSARRLVMPDLSDGFRAAGRLRPGVSRQAATAAVQVVASRTAASDHAARAIDAATTEEAPGRKPSAEVVALLSANGDPMFERDVRLMSFLIGLLGLLVLLVTCTNVSALLTGLATARRQEIAIRLSLGASRSRLIRQLLTESALLASLAGAAALGSVWLVMRSVVRSIPQFPLAAEITWPVTTFTFGVALAVGVLFGLSPALHATRLALASALRDSSASIAAARGRLQRGLVVAQIAFTQPLIVLLSAVLLLILGNYGVQSRTELADRLVRVSLRPPAALTGSSAATPESTEQLRITMDRLLDRLQATPGVDAAALDWGSSTQSLGAYLVHPGDRVGEAPGSTIRLSGETAGEEYFEVMGISFLRGRSFGSGDMRSSDPATAEVPVIVGHDLARQLWAGADPVGRRLQTASDSVTGVRSLVVVGVIDDPLAERRNAGEDFRVYLPPESGKVSTALVVRTSGSADPLIRGIRGIVQEEAPGMGSSVRTLAEIEAVDRRNFRLVTGGVSAAGLMALLLSAIGLYAVVAFSVGQRTREIAVRIAVGARGRQIVQRFVIDGLRLSALGLALGLPLSLIGLRALLSSAEISSVPLPRVIVIAAAGVILVSTAAAWLPARRVAAVDPAVALRRE